MAACHLQGPSRGVAFVRGCVALVRKPNDVPFEVPFRALELTVCMLAQLLSAAAASDQWPAAAQGPGLAAACPAMAEAAATGVLSHATTFLQGLASKLSDEERRRPAATPSQDSRTLQLLGRSCVAIIGCLSAADPAVELGSAGPRGAVAAVCSALLAA